MALSELESSEATLEESSGTSVSLLGRRASNDHRGGNRWSGAQQKVSRDHSLQAIFSYLFPSSIAGEHLEKTLQRPKRFSTFLVSIVCIEPGSTLTIGRSERRGILTASRAVVAGEQRYLWVWSRIPLSSAGLRLRLRQQIGCRTGSEEPRLRSDADNGAHGEAAINMLWW